MIIIREKKAPEIPEKELAVIYADSVLLHYAIFGKMLEAKDNWHDQPAIISQIHKREFDTDPAAFYASLEKAAKSKHGAHLAKRSLPALKKMKTFKLKTIDAGFALTTGKGQPPFSEITALHNASNIPNIGINLMDAAIALGGRYLECFGEHLKKTLYFTKGFAVYHSIPNIKMRNGKTRTLYFMHHKSAPAPKRNFKEICVSGGRLIG